MTRERPTSLLVDLDGVLRRWDPAVIADIERRYDVPAGAVEAAATEWSRLKPAITGQISHDEWLAQVIRALAEQIGDEERARAAVTEWRAYRGFVDADVLGFIREIRGAGFRVGLATNGTDALDADLAELNLVGEVDAVINSSVVGANKPAREFFAEACRVIGALPKHVLHIDDDDRAVRGARVAGLSAHRWTGPHDLTYLRALFAR
ncbi:MAG TPA: HAD family hydrolase [Micromonospora sp.]